MYTFSPLGEYNIPKRVKFAHSATKLGLYNQGVQIKGPYLGAPALVRCWRLGVYGLGLGGWRLGIYGLGHRVLSAEVWGLGFNKTLGFRV